MGNLLRNGYVLVAIALGACLMSCIGEVGHACQAEEREALLRLRKAAIPAAAWRKWDAVEAAECCKWEGVGCDKETGRVISLKLADCEGCGDNYEIKASCGVLPLAVLGSLQSLQVLDLWGGCFTGAIDGHALASLTNLSYLDLGRNGGLADFYLAPLQEHPLLKLQYLDLSSNWFAFNVSQVVRAFPGLTHLDLSYNKLTGVIPEEFSALQNLTYLNLSGNAFQNPVPWQSLGRLSQLRHLALGGSTYALLWEEKKASSPLCTWAQSLESLSCINMGFNVTSNVSLPFCLDSPAAVSKLRSLSFTYATMPMGPLLRNLLQPNATFLALTSMSLESSTSLREFQGHPFPTSLNAPFLATLDLSGCNLTSIPLWLSQLPLLHTLNLAWNPQLDLSTLHTYPSLKYLDVSRCDIGVRQPPSLAGPLPHLPGHLETLIISYNSLTQMPAAFNNLAHLRELDMSNNLLNGSSLRESLQGQQLFLMNSTQLTSLQLSNQNSLGGGVLQFFLKPSLVSLDLSWTNLSGAIPLSIGNLSFLSKLDLSWNNLSGVVPHSLGNLSMLSELDLSGNQLSEAIPLSIGSLARLSTLDLSWNQLSGALPQSIGNLSMLSELSLFQNHLSGAVPHLIANLASLSILDLSNNQLTGVLPSSIGNLASLSKAKLSSNKLSGPLPLSIGNLSSLSSLDLHQNNLSGAIPPLTENLVFLSYLDLSSNGLSSAIPSLIWNLSSLSVLLLSSNFLSGPIPSFSSHDLPLTVVDLSSNSFSGTLSHSYFVNLTSPIFDLRLSHNSLTGNLPMIIGQKTTNLDMQYNFFSGSISINSSSLRNLYLSNNRLSGSVHEIFHNCESLWILDLSSNAFSGTIPGQIGRCPLVWLFLPSNKLHGSIPQEIGLCSELVILDLGKNSLNSNIPASLGQLAFLQALLLDSNRLGGELPTALRECKSLVVLDLSNNQFIGGIPDWITGANFPSLQVLLLGHNRFKGSIPVPLVQNLTSVRVLDLADNSLSGSIPSVLDHLQGMAYREDQAPVGDYSDALYEIQIGVSIKGSNSVNIGPGSTLFIITAIDLSNNFLEGKIPPQIGALTGLYSLNLSHNKLSGPIPTTLGALSRALESLDLSNNGLTGSIPRELCTLHFLGVLNLSSNRLQGEIPQSASCTQLSSFNASAFSANEGLCGFPLPNQCTIPPVQNTPHVAESASQPPSLLAKIQEHIQLEGIGIGYPLGFFLMGLLLHYRR